ncbi:MAG: NADH-quinone oxidoreductase subunit J [Phycisphaerales bacterium]|jgi:NADH-quinone oxidoreductase subunit J|nr:NADH-quinone oxidoreductase subunit J [Phycisphaerales bacterium]
MDLLLPYIATAVAAVGLLMVLSSSAAPVRAGGGVLGLAGLVWLFILASTLPGGVGDVASEVFFLVFAAMAVAAAVQMIRSPRPVYSALFFVLVVMSVCGMLVMMEAFFMAFALVIVYAGAILITYMFVLMLAQQASEPSNQGETPEYDRSPRDPVAAVCLAALFMGIVVNVTFTGLTDLAPAATNADRLQADAALLSMLPREVRRQVGDGVVLPESLEGQIAVQGDGLVLHADSATGEPLRLALESPGNTSHVGWSLVASFPASLELAGVILLMAMFGAVVLARRQIDHAEEDLASAMAAPESSEADE